MMETIYLKMYQVRLFYYHDSFNNHSTNVHCTLSMCLRLLVTSLDTRGTTVAEWQSLSWRHPQRPHLIKDLPTFVNSLDIILARSKYERKQGGDVFEFVFK
jgi:hypothetical protein